jgi:hypothetical protein
MKDLTLNLEEMALLIASVVSSQVLQDNFCHGALFSFFLGVGIGHSCQTLI